jgi:putrescine transport system ATP-binding protein
LTVVSTPALEGEFRIAGHAEPGTEVAIALRPEKVRFLAPGESSAINRLSGTVWDIGYLGDWTTYRVKLLNGAIIRLARANSLRNDPHAPSWDESVTLTFDPDAAILLSR